jgi:hypothetical protein
MMDPVFGESRVAVVDGGTAEAAPGGVSGDTGLSLARI